MGIGLSGDCFHCSFDDVRGVETELAHQFIGFSAFAEVVVNGHHFHGGWEFPCQKLADAVAHSAVHKVFLGGNHVFGLGNTLQYSFFI